jgi:hypothetical protein
MLRPDQYVIIHKALRSALFDVAARAARTDFGSPAEAQTTLGDLDRALRLLRHHAEVEDAFLEPLVRAVAPELARSIARDHADLELRQQAVDELMARVAATPLAERAPHARALLGQVNQLVADHLRHMHREETEVTEALWAGFSDAELAAVTGRIFASIPPERTAEMMQLLLPAVNRVERAAIIAARPAAAARVD